MVGEWSSPPLWCTERRHEEIIYSLLSVMRKACIWILSMLSGNTERPKDFYQQWVKLVSLCVYIFMYIFPFPVGIWIHLCISLVMSKALDWKQSHTALESDLSYKIRQKVMPVSSCIITNSGWIYSRKMCIAAVWGVSVWIHFLWVFCSAEAGNTFFPLCLVISLQCISALRGNLFLPIVAYEGQ